jgi:hypothetical protein
MFWPQLDIGWLCIIAFAGMMAFGIGLVNCSAAGALQAIKHRKPNDGRQVEWAVLVPGAGLHALASCSQRMSASTSAGKSLSANAPEGAKIAAGVVTIDAVFYIFAFAKPAMAWIVEGRKTMDAEGLRCPPAPSRRQEAAEMAAAAEIDPRWNSAQQTANANRIWKLLRRRAIAAETALCAEPHCCGEAQPQTAEVAEAAPERRPAHPARASASPRRSKNSAPPP